MSVALLSNSPLSFPFAFFSSSSIFSFLFLLHERRSLYADVRYIDNGMAFYRPGAFVRMAATPEKAPSAAAASPASISTSSSPKLSIPEAVWEPAEDDIVREVVDMGLAVLFCSFGYCGSMATLLRVLPCLSPLFFISFISLLSLSRFSPCQCQCQCNLYPCPVTNLAPIVHAPATSSPVRSEYARDCAL